MIDKKISNNPLKDILADLQMFQQTNYCYDYIKMKYPEYEEDKILSSSEIASACFRQANEFLTSAKNASLSTSPLLYSYALNNFAKGTAYLLFLENDNLKYLKKHGFNVKDENLSNSILKSKISLEQSGVPTFILKLFDNHVLSKQDISFELLLSQIPEISDIFTKTTAKPSSIAKMIPNEKDEFISNCNDYSEIKDKENIFKEYGIVGDYNKFKKGFQFYFNMLFQEKFEKNEVIKKNLFYKEYLILPNKFEDGIHDINLTFYCYLLIMGYGMLVRYNAHKWEKFIDPKISSESTLIAMSVDVCVNDFLVLIHEKLLGYTYEEDKYNDFDVKSVINSSTKEIMNNITSEISSHNFIFNSKIPLPWPEKMR